MTTSKIIRNSIAKFSADYVFSAKDFSLGPMQRQAVTKTLQRLASSGAIQVLSKGRYYKPRVTQFGPLKPSPAQIAREYLINDGEIIGYLTGSSVFTQFALTTQISSKIQIGTNTYRQPVQRNAYSISFVVQPNPINQDNIDILPVLDCLRFIKKIPATTTDDACRRMICIIKDLPDEKKLVLVNNALNYPQSVRALCGAILEFIGADSDLTDMLKQTISNASKSLYNISTETLPTKLNWRIYEPSRK